MLTWKNDSLLLNSEGTVKEMIENEDKDLVLLDRNVLNLYPALVKRGDFVKTSDYYYTLFKKTPFVSLEPNLLDSMIKLIPNDYNEITNRLYKYTKFQIGSELAKTRRRIERKAERGIISIIVLRIAANLLERYGISNELKVLSKFFKNIKYIWAQNVPKVTLPLTLEDLSSDELVYLAGVLAGDGCLSDRGNDIIISDGHPNESQLSYSHEYLCSLKKIIEQNFRYSLTQNVIKKKKRNYYELRFANKMIYRFLNYFFDMPTGIKYSKLTTPKIFELSPLKKSERAEAVYWRGYADADGSINKRRSNVEIGGKNKRFILELMSFLQSIGFKPSLRSKKTQYMIHVHFYDLLKYAELIGSSHPRKSKNLLQRLETTPNKKICRGLIEENLTGEGYFDFSKIKINKLNDLKVYNAGSILNKIRKQLELTYMQIATKFEVSTACVNYWEQDKHSVPFQVLLELSRNMNVNIYHLLEKEEIRWKVCNSPEEVRLPLKPDPNTNEIINYLSPIFSPRKYAKKTYIVKGFPDQKEDRKEFDKILRNIREKFGLKIKYNGKNFYIDNRALHRFLLTFYNYKFPWKSINSKHKEKFLKKWEVGG